MPGRFRRIVRRLFRLTCRLLVLLVLALLVIAVYLERAGVPQFAKTRLVETVRNRGWDIEFSALRFHWYRGVVAENLHLQRSRKKPGPIIFIDEAACRLNGAALRNFVLQVDSILLRGGRIVWPLTETNEQTATFQLEKIGGELLIKPNDLWQLRSLTAEVLGMRMEISGSLTNASLVRDWRLPKATRESAEATQALWRRIVSTAGRVKFVGQPQLFTHFDGDAADMRRLDADLKFIAAGIETPWGDATNSILHVRVLPARDSNPLQADLELTVDNPATDWCRARKLRLNWEVEPPFVSLFPNDAHVAVDLLGPETPWARARHAVATVHVSPTNSTTMRTDIQATLDQLQSEWGQSDFAQLIGTLTHSGTNLVDANVSGELRITKPRTKWGEALGATISATASFPGKDHFALFRTNLLWSERLHGLLAKSSVVATNFSSPQLQFESLALETTWKDTHVGLRTDISLYGGTFNATGELDSVTRELTFSSRSTFDPHGLTAILTPKTQAWLASYSWHDSPKVQSTGRVILPAWTNRAPDWQGEVRPTLCLRGSFEVGAGAYRDASFSSAASPFTLTNLFWRMDDLNVRRPEGILRGEYSSDLASRDFHWRVHSQFDPRIARPLLEGEPERKALDCFQFTVAPEIDAEVWGRWGDPDRVGLLAQVRATNFVFRGEKVTTFTSGLSYTNKLLIFSDPHVRQGMQEGSAPKVIVDFVTQKLYLTNAFGNLNPYAVARVISDKSLEAITPYQFDAPPATKVSGSVDLKKGRHDDDLHFELKGGIFRWRQFRLQRIAGQIDWVGDKLSLNNVVGSFRNGDLAGAAAFDFTRGQGAIFAFNLGVTNADLRTFMPDVGYPTNKLEGLFNGYLNIREGKTAVPNSWQGETSMTLRDGLIWDIPMFGAFSPVLNSIVPGLGNSRAKQGNARFYITNSVLITRDPVEIRATAMRMNFEGGIDFDGNLEGRIEAELLRDIPAIGIVISKLLWPITKIFEYKITGTINHPRTEPLYIIPKILLLPFHPIKTIKDMLLEEPKPAPPPK